MKNLEASARSKKKKTDIMGPVAACSDRLGLSVRKKAMFAASVARAAGVSVDDTNISRSTAWRRSQEERVKSATAIKDNFVVPPKCVIHWDGKRIKVKGGATSERVVVYATGADAAKTRKLLGVPEVQDGTGASESRAVQDVLKKWAIFKEVVGVVFDTTASNSGHKSGACVFIERYINRPVLWLACRHHCHELHIKHAVTTVTGNSKDPGVVLFRKLRNQWNSLSIDHSTLSKFSYDAVDPWLAKTAREVLEWANQQLEAMTWPRADYQELLHLLVVFLGGSVDNFNFKRPGADHHAR